MLYNKKVLYWWGKPYKKKFWETNHFKIFLLLKWHFFILFLWKITRNLSISVLKRTANDQSDEANKTKIYSKIRILEVRSCTIYETCIYLSIYLSIYLQEFSPVLCHTAGDVRDASDLNLSIYLSFYLSYLSIYLYNLYLFTCRSSPQFGVTLVMYEMLQRTFYIDFGGRGVL